MQFTFYVKNIITKPIRFKIITGINKLKEQLVSKINRYNNIVKKLLSLIIIKIIENKVKLTIANI